MQAKKSKQVKEPSLFYYNSNAILPKTNRCRSKSRPKKNNNIPQQDDLPILQEEDSFRANTILYSQKITPLMTSIKTNTNQIIKPVFKSNSSSALNSSHDLGTREKLHQKKYFLHSNPSNSLAEVQKEYEQQLSLVPSVKKYTNKRKFRTFSKLLEDGNSAIQNYRKNKKMKLEQKKEEEKSNIQLSLQELKPLKANVPSMTLPLLQNSIDPLNVPSPNIPRIIPPAKTTIGINQIKEENIKMRDNSEILLQQIVESKRTGQIIKNEAENISQIITQNLNQLSSDDYSSQYDKVRKITDILQRYSTNRSMLLYSIYRIAFSFLKKIPCWQDAKFLNNDENHFQHNLFHNYARLVIEVDQVVPGAIQLLCGRLFKYATFLIPEFPDYNDILRKYGSNEIEAKKEYYSLQGYSVNAIGIPESFEKYYKRMVAFFAFYLYIANYLPDQEICGKLWLYLSSYLNMKITDSLLLPILVFQLLKRYGHKFFQYYAGQYQKLLEYIRGNYIARLKRRQLRIRQNGDIYLSHIHLLERQVAEELRQFL